MIPAAAGSPPTNENARRQPGVGQNKTTASAFCYPAPASVKGHDEQQTMSSVEIAKLTGKEHKNVLADTRNMLNDLGKAAADFSATAIVDGPNGSKREIEVFNLPKRETLILVSGYNIAMRAKIIDRWQDLEAKQQFAIPNTLSGALMLAAKQAEQIEKQGALIEQQKSAVEFHGTVCDAINAQTVEEVAKVLGTGRNRLFDWLRTRKIFKSDNLPYQDFIDRQYFRVTERAYTDKKGEAHTYTRTLVTGKGLAYIQSNFSAGGA